MTRLCKADGLIRGRIQPCRAYGSTRYQGFCWAHWQIALETWGDHFWYASAYRR